MLLEQRIDLEVTVTSERADAKVRAVFFDIAEVREATDVDDDGRRCEAVLHERNQRVAPREQFGIVTVLLQ